ncbi:Prolyl endopeptidase precursor [Tsuneonella dongtanensis]|uniref:prolyl oligopeptidase n=1 Tax=Tsuneonella dongtanensis TaxID=692370 RepID=A0A1B2ACD1_9SPHN|nr:prolyl oligopeptidase family serine peptidase [Tsuneonella dongtanensis]ANY19822.1 Prolyl endopeptidase precursor [Tsuneonella dongtanensis]
MTARSSVLLGIASLLALTAPASPAMSKDDALPEPRPVYPVSERVDIVETLFGERIADPFRWLEADVRSDPRVAKWVAAQNAVSRGYLGSLPGRDWFSARIAELMNYERFGIPRKFGNRYFYTRNTGLQNQSPLYVQDGLDGKRRLLLDPNAWSRDAATALSEWQPSPDGSKLLYMVQDGGTDWRIIRALEVATGEPLADEVRWAKFTALSWVGEEGFLYSRFPEPEKDRDFQALNYDHAVYFHRIGTPQSEDEQVFSTPDFRERGYNASVSDDGRWAFITSSTGTDARNELQVIDLSLRARTGWHSRPLVSGFDHDWRVIDTVGSTLYLKTNKDAPTYRIVKVDLEAKTPKFETVVPARSEPIDGASIVGDRLIVSFLKDAASRAEVFTLDGKPGRIIELNGLGSATGFGGKPGDPETFYNYASFNQPGGIYRLDLETGKSTPFATPDIAFDPADYAVDQVFYPSKDGTRIPMFLVKRKDVTGPAPTLLYGYGGFDNALTPTFSSVRMAWVDAGGVFALANIRGGGEYGKAWHDAGRLHKKQNVFDDFAAAGEWLKANGVTSERGLAIQGGSNGGLLVGAVVNQRPDLIDAAHAAVGVMDMLRFDRWTAGRYWVDDYGYPSKEADFRVLRSYSPYHNIRAGADYPAVLVTTADTDDRVVPGHSFKYAAALQAAEAGDKPHLIRIETRAGHGGGKPTDKAIAEGADVLAFLARWTGLDVGGGASQGDPSIPTAVKESAE